jgi:DNA-binding NarL/FixJ family response regulator
MHLLCIAAAPGAAAALAETVAADSAVQISFDLCPDPAAAAERLRVQGYDAVLAVHDPPRLDALTLVEALRAAGHEEPLVILGRDDDRDLVALAYEVGADGCLAPHDATRTLYWVLARAAERARLLAEHRRLAQADHRRRATECLEAERLLAEQRTLLAGLERLRAVDSEHHADQARESPATIDFASNRSRAVTAPPADTEAFDPLLDTLRPHYVALLRAQVMMGSGSLVADVERLADLLATADAAPRAAVRLHVLALEQVLAGLGGRSARHVLARADLLALDLLVHLGEAYRRRADGLDSSASRAEAA